MVQDKYFHHGECIWELTYDGLEYIFSDCRLDETMPNGYYTENIPFRNFSHYFYYDEARDVYTGYAWYSPTENYVAAFNSLEECLDWLVPNPELYHTDISLKEKIISVEEKKDLKQINNKTCNEITR